MTPTLVLVVDDDAEAADALGELLRLRLPGLMTLVRYDGRSAIAAALAQHPDVITLDLELPDVHGNAVATAIRAAARAQHGGSRPLIIALSGQVDDVFSARKNPAFDAAFTKPADVQALVDAIVRA